MNPRVAVPVFIGLGVMGLLALLTVPMMIVGGASLLSTGNGGTGCDSSGGASTAQPAEASAGKGIPSNYLSWYKKVGQQYNVPWVILAGIGTEESDNGQSKLPGVASGQNGFGAAGPMQLGIGGASGNTWTQVATNEDGKGAPSPYDPADAIAGAAKFLIAHGVQTDPSAAIFAYNHADWYVQDVLNFASNYSSGGFSVTTAQQSGGSSTCAGNVVLASSSVPNSTVAAAIDYAQQQVGKPYQWGATGPDAFDCSGLMMMAYRAAGVSIARTSEQEWATEKHVSASQVQPGDLVFFAGTDGTASAPGHVGMVIGQGKMIEAFATGFPVRISSYGQASDASSGEQKVVGFTNPWASSQVGPVAAGAAPPAGAQPKPKKLRALGVPGRAPHRPAARPGLGQRPGQFLGQPDQRVGRAGHHVLGDVGDPPAARSRRPPQQVEGVPRLQPVPLGQDPDRLLDPNPGGEGVLQLGNGDRQALSLPGLGLRPAPRIPGTPGPIIIPNGSSFLDPSPAGSFRCGRRCGRRRNGSHGLVRGEQVGQHHRAGEIRHVLVADDPAVLALAHHDSVISAY